MDDPTVTSPDLHAQLIARAGDLGTGQRLRLAGDNAVLTARALAPGGGVLSSGVTIGDETPLGRYLARGVINIDQYEAGLRLSRLWAAAVDQPRLTMNWAHERVSGARPFEHSQFSIDARRILWDALVTAGLAIAFPTASSRADHDASENVALRLTTAGHQVIALVVFDKRPGGTRALAAVRQGLEALSSAFGSRATPSRTHIMRGMAERPPPRDLPEARDMSWAEARNRSRRRALARQATYSDGEGPK